MYKVTYADVFELDPVLYDNIIGLRQLEKEGADIEDLALTFSVSQVDMDYLFTTDLINDGRNIVVTNETLEDYIHKRF